MVAAGVVAAIAPFARSQPAVCPPPEEPAPDEPVLTAKQLFADPAAMTEGANVRLEGAVVRAKSGNILRVATQRHEIFVAPNDPSAIAFIAVGAHVDVIGTLRRVPSAKQARLVYAMSSSEAYRLARTRFYIDAWDVSAIE